MMLFGKLKKTAGIPALLCLIAFSFLPARAATVDNDGMPLVYLRGDMTGWAAANEYKFTRSGNTYTLQINAANALPQGRFKIADDNWEMVDFGGEQDNIYIDDSTIITLKRSGANLHTNGISDAVITFKYTQGNTCNVSFDIAGSPMPDPGDLTSGTLPVMYINVYTDDDHTAFDDEVTDYNLSHKDYFTHAEYWLDTKGCKWLEDMGAKSVGSKEEPLPLQIKARGNWTRIGFSKKPFKLKLDKKQDLLGLTPEKSKHYALLAHADDRNGYLRNFTFFNLGKRIGLPWTPEMQPVELVINGDYRGLYFLTESIRAQEGRVEIAELEDNATDPDLVSGGYIVELDNYYEENQIRMPEMSWVDNQHLDELRVTWDTPEEYSYLQQRFITDQFSAINNAVGSNNNALWSYLDQDDAARYYLVCEIVSHTEAFHGSTYLFRDRGENQKWHFSPLWDAGNAFQGHTNDFFYNCDPFGNTWIPSMRENAAFNNKVKETWLWFMQNEYPGIEADIDTFTQHISQAVKTDYSRWAGMPVPSNGQEVADNRDIASKARDVKKHLADKTEWLKGVFGNYTQGNHAEPARDTTPAAALPDYAQAAVEEIEMENPGGETLYFNLQGLRVTHPKPGEIYIVKKGNRTFKAILK